MANKALKSIKFPGLPNTYLIPPQSSDFSTSTTYAVGSYCVYQGKLYRFTTAHPSGAWNAAHVTEAKAADDIGGKLDKDQGSGNAGKFLVVGNDGKIAPVTMQAWQGGSY